MIRFTLYLLEIGNPYFEQMVVDLYKYNILERILVENIIQRNVIINRGAVEVDKHISRDDILTSTLSRMLYIVILLYRTLFLYFLTMVRGVPKTTQCALATNGFTKGLRL